MKRQFLGPGHRDQCSQRQGASARPRPSDIRPADVLADCADGTEYRLTGLGIASRLPSQHQTPEPPAVIAGTLAYMTPEQNQAVRPLNELPHSDLYALGVTFYQMLTGSLPFSAGDPIE